MKMLVKPLKKLSILRKFYAFYKLYRGSSWKKNPLYAWGKSALGISLLVSLLGLSVRQLGLLEASELRAFDQMMRWRGAEEPDSRFLVVKITEEDIRKYNYPLSDQILYELLETLEQNDPVVIGLDIFRDQPVEPGFAQLATKFQTSDRIVAICRNSMNDDNGTPPPPTMDLSQVGFSDISIDRDGITRRGSLIFPLAPQDSCQTELSLSIQLAARYLAQIHQIFPEENETGDRRTLGRAMFQPLPRNFGGYQQADSGGLQVLLNYRSPKAGSPTLNLADVLENNFDPALVRDKIILIGSTAPSLKDRFFTPYSAESQRKMPGVFIHAQLTSQFLDAALGERPLFWFLSEWQEVLWIIGWSITGGWVAYKIRHPIRLILAEGIGLGLLLGVSYGLFLQAGWVPLITPAIGLVGSGMSVLAYSAYQDKKAKEALVREKEKIIRCAEQQKMDLQELELLVEDYKKREALQHSNGADEPTTSLPEGEMATAIAPQAHTWTMGVGSTLKEHYKLERVLGSGGFGYTYLAEDIQNPHAPRCVVKHLQPACRDTRVMEISRRLFRTEAEILEKLGNHPQIPYLLDHFEEQEEFYLVEEYIPGNLLSDELLPDQRLEQGIIVELLQELLSVLVYLHEHKVIHRDVKPSNIIRAQPDNRLVLIDFGAVKQIQPQALDKVPMTIAIGTRGYASPEQLAGQPNITSDLYALGMIAIKGLTGISPDQLPVNPENGRLDWQKYTSAEDEFVAILDKMVSPYLGERYPSGTEILEVLEALSNVSSELGVRSSQFL